MVTKIDRTERVLNLTAILLDAGRPLTRSELREKVEGYPDNDDSFRRAFERDKELIREVGIPLEVQPIAYSDIEGYRIPPEKYYLQGATFTPAELAALHVATLAVQFGSTDEEALWKLGGLGVTDAAGVGFESPISELPADSVLLDVFHGIQSRTPLRFDYRKSTGAITSRVVEPWSLNFQRGRWYLRALDRSAGQQRSFRLDRMAVVEQLEGEFVEPVDLDVDHGVLRPWEIGTSEPVQVELFVAEAAVAPVAERVGDDPVRTHVLGGRAGSVFVLSARAVDAAISFALEWLDDAVILGPPEVRAGIVALLEGSAQRAES
ncbi:MAG: helix-turn-helix transcriptional regulator [Acidimicrobiales bacterium]